MTEQIYYVLSLKWSRGEKAVWWGPNNNGYTARLDRAGVYTQEQIDAQPNYYNNKRDTLAIPVEKVVPLTRLIVMFEDLHSFGAKRCPEFYAQFEEDEE